MKEDRVGDKILEIEQFFEELNQVLPSSFEQYEQDFRIKAICERYFEKIVEAAIDLAYLFIKKKKWKFPESEKELFETLADQGIISRELALRLKDAKGMRNVIAHQYGEINDEMVFTAVTEELEKDIKGLIESIQ